MNDPDGIRNMLSGYMTSIWATIWLADGIGWWLLSRHATNSARIARVGITAFTAGALWLIASCLFKYVAYQISYTVFAVSMALVFAGIQRYFVWSENWRPIKRILSHIGYAKISYDIPEVMILAVIWLISLNSLGKGVFTGATLIFWNIAGSVSSVRVFDFPAAVGIGASPIIRLICLWLARGSVAVAALLIILKLTI